MKNNTVERAITPYNPSQSEVHQKDRYNLYAPLVRRNQPGIAQFNPNDFRISDGVVSAQIKNVGAIQYSGTPIQVSDFIITWNINSISAKLIKDAVPGDLILALTDDERNGDIYQIITVVDNEIISSSTRIGTLLGPQGFDALTYSEIYYSDTNCVVGLNIIQELYKFNREAFVGDVCNISVIDMTQTPWITYDTVCKVTFVDPVSMENRYVTLEVTQMVRSTGPVGAQGAKGDPGVSVSIVGGIYYTGDSPTVEGDLPLPAFAETQEGNAYIVRDTAKKYDFYMHNVGASDWVIIDDWGGVPGPKGDTGNIALTYDEIYFTSSPISESLVIAQEVAKFNRTAVIGDVCNIFCVDMTTSFWHAYVTTCLVTNVDAQFVTLKVNKYSDITGQTGNTALEYSRIIPLTAEPTGTAIELQNSYFNRIPVVGDAFTVVGSIQDGDAYFITLSVQSVDSLVATCIPNTWKLVEALPAKDALTYSEIYYSANAVNTSLVIVQEVAKFNRTAVIGDVCNICCVENSTQDTYMTVCTVTNVDTSYVTLSVKSASKLSAVGITNITITEAT